MGMSERRWMKVKEGKRSTKMMEDEEYWDIWNVYVIASTVVMFRYLVLSVALAWA